MTNIYSSIHIGRQMIVYLEHVWRKIIYYIDKLIIMSLLVSKNKVLFSAVLSEIVDMVI